jgi:hypothetical protein
MLGKDLSEETLDILDNILHMNRDKIEMTDIETIRHEIDALYDIGKSNVFGAAMNLSVIEEEVDFFSKIEDGYSKFMQEYEEYIDKSK